MINRFSGRYYFLSNFFPCVVDHNGIKYTSAEHAYQACKSLSDVDKYIIWSQDTAAKAKQQGRRITMREDWNEVKIEQMREVLLAKFLNYELRKYLMATDGLTLIEGNTWGDTFWGQCPVGEGSNNLGILLMEVRDYYLKLKTS